MKWRCKFCGFEIKNREDKISIRIKDKDVYVVGYCDNCLNWTILKRISTEEMREYINSKIDTNSGNAL